jgi:mono/diheme cytochrome c family protein
MRFLAGVLFGILLVGLGAVAFLATGSFNTAATLPPGKVEKRVAALALTKSVQRRASSTKNPFAGKTDAMRGGLEHYKEMCVTCHGAPGVDPSEIGEGLNPPAPDLTLQKVQERTDGQLFWLVQNGIRMTGMPAFGPTHKDEEIWKIVAFLRHLPELTAEEEKQLKRAE